MRAGWKNRMDERRYFEQKIEARRARSLQRKMDGWYDSHKRELLLQQSYANAAMNSPVVFGTLGSMGGSLK